MIVRVGCALAECQRDSGHRIGVGNRDRHRRVVEVPRVAKIAGQLAARFRARENDVSNAARGSAVHQVCLIEQIAALSRVVIGRESNLCFARIHDARNKVLITAIIIADREPVLNIETAGLVFDGCRCKVHARPHVAVIGIPDVCGNIEIGGPASK